MCRAGHHVVPPRDISVLLRVCLAARGCVLINGHQKAPVEPVIDGAKWSIDPRIVNLIKK